MSAQAHPFGHAIVLGASMAGLLAARVASEHFQTVTLVERDPLTPDYEPRKGVPQGKHVHVLLARGAALLDSFFPNLMRELEAQSAVRINAAQDTRWYHFGGWKLRHKGPLEIFLMSRPFLEQNIRARVCKFPNVRVMAGTAVQELVADASGRVTGVRIQNSRGESEILYGSLVIDATGRSGQAGKWLEAMGYAKPEEEKVEVELNLLKPPTILFYPKALERVLRNS